MVKRKLPWKTETPEEEAARKRARATSQDARDSAPGPAGNSSQPRTPDSVTTRNAPEKTAESVSQADKLKKLATDLYGKIIQKDAFSEDFSVPNYWEASDRDPVKNLKAAAPLFALQDEDHRSWLIANASGLYDDGMRARCLQEISVNAQYRNHINSEDLKLLEENVNTLLDLHENDAIQLPDDCDMMNAYEQLRVIHNEPSSARGKSPEIKSKTPPTAQLTKEIGEIVNADKLDFDKTGAAALSLKEAIDNVTERTAAREALLRNRGGSRSSPEVIDLT